MILRPSTLIVLAVLFLTLGASGARSQSPAASPAPGFGPLTPEQSQKTFKIAPGFHMELVASEPLVDHPVAIDFDADGRLWVVEMPSYMKDVSGMGMKAPIGRVVVLEDTDGDGRMDKRTVFLDELVLPRTIKVVGKGALVGEPPHLWYCPDANGDLKADSKIPVASDYFLRADNPELGPNGAMWAMDNWIYQAAYGSRLRWQKDGTFQREGEYEMGQWGLSQDDVGRLYYNNNHDQLHADFVPATYFLRNPESNGHSGVDIPLTQDQTIWPARPTPDVNEGYKPEMLRADGSLKEFTAACGPVVYRGDAYPPELLGNGFVCEPAANLIKRNVVTEKGVLLEARPAYDKSEWVASTDPWFRPVNLANAPDGTLYVVDMYKGIIIYKQFMSPAMRKLMAQRRDPPTPLGRIWRVVADGAKPAARPTKLSGSTTAQLVDALLLPSGWWRDTAQRLLIERGDPAAVPLLRALASSKGPRTPRLHALWTLEGLGALDETTVVGALKDPDRKIRAAGLRLSEPMLRATPGGTVEREVLALASDKQREVRVQYAFTLGESSSAEARAAQLAMLNANPGDIFIVDALLSGMRGHEMEALTALHADPTWGTSNPGRVRTLRSLAQCIAHARKADDMLKLLRMIAGNAPAPTPAPVATPGAAAAGALGWQEAALLEGIYNSVRFGSP